MLDGSVLVAFTFALAVALQGDPGFDQGVRLYKQTEYEQAIVQFQQVSARADLAAADKAEALLWLGLSYAGSGDVDTARSTLRDALLADPAVALPAQTSPSIVAMFDTVRAEVAAIEHEPPPLKPPVAPAPAGEVNLVVIGAGAAAVSAVVLVTGSVLALLANASLQTANDSEQFQSDAKAALDGANAQALGAGLLLPVGVALGVAGGVLIAMGLE